MSGYLRVKKWRKHQHYAKRRPPWIKFYNALLDDDSFGELGELEQWQLVRIWLLASKSTRFVLDEEGVPVPVVPREESMLRRSIKSLKPVPVGKLERSGFLIPVDDKAVILASTSGEIADMIASALASTDASALLTRADARPGATEEQRETRETEDQGLPSLALAKFPAFQPGPDNSPLGKLRRACSVDEGSADAGKLERAMRGVCEADVVDIAFKCPGDVRSRLGWTLSELKKRRVA